MNSTGYSQQTVLNKNGDTTICFLLPQAKFLLKQVYKVQELDTLNKLCKLQLQAKDSVISNQAHSIMSYELIVKNMREIDTLRQYELTKMNEALALEKRKTKHERWKKRAVTIVGTVTTGLMSYFYFREKIK